MVGIARVTDLVRRALVDDAALCVGLDRDFSPVFSKLESYKRLLARKGLVLLAETHGEPAGMAVLEEQAGELALHNLLVVPRYRRQGFATALLKAVGKHASAEDLNRVTLEVRESNRAALALYESRGFQVDARRPGYYPGGDSGARETAILMSLVVSEPPDADARRPRRSFTNAGADST